MCFSAQASFTASAVLALVGIASVKKVSLPAQTAFACIPFLFAFQQFTEGLLWLSFTHPEFSYLKSASTYSFLIVAQIIWPTWVPLSILFLEQNIKRKRVLTYILSLGILLSLYLSYCYIIYPIHAEISGHHIKYNLEFPHTQNLLWLSAFFYFIPTVVSTLVSSVNRMQILGITILTSCIITRIITPKYFISIWCFFAAIISVLVLVILKDLKKSTENSSLV
ncbi:MAG: hypothetical protein IPP32_09145 [Bacteroidetes bacterium]|nr:hypothetical protein [Bacteroidota bacterium]